MYFINNKNILSSESLNAYLDKQSNIEDPIAKVKAIYDSRVGGNQKYMWQYYSGDKAVIPVYQRRSVSPLKESSHTNMHIDFFGDIISIKTGYLGEKISIIPDSESLEPFLKQWMIESKLQTLLTQTTEYTSVEGLSHTLCYTEDGQFKMKNIHGSDVVYEFDLDIFKPKRAFYYWEEESIEGVKTQHCNVYDTEMVYYYDKVEIRKKKWGYILRGQQAHNFQEVPIAPFQNNSNWEPDCSDALDAMNAYDEIISDTTGEIKAARLAYLKVFGDIYTGIDAHGEQIPLPIWLREFGTMAFPQDENGHKLGDAAFLEKNLNSDAIEKMLDRLRTHIYESSGSIDLRELTESNSQRVFSVKASMMRFESNAKTTESYLRLGIEKLLRLWTYWLREYEGVSGVNEWDFTIKIDRTFPIDIESMARTATILSSVMAPEDAFRIAGFENPEQIAIRFEELGGLLMPPIQTEGE